MKSDAPAILQQLEQFVMAVVGILTDSSLGSFASIVGAGLSFYVLLSVRDIRKRVLLKVRAPETINELSDFATTISNSMQDFDANLLRINEQIALALVTLKNVRGKVTGEPKRTINSAVKAIQAYQSRPPLRRTRDAVRDIYVHILVSVKTIQLIIADVREEP